MPEIISLAKLVQVQSDAVLDQANPTSGNKYEVLAETKNVRIITVGAKVTWTVQPSPLEIHITIDGVPYTFAVTNPVSATFYRPAFYCAYSEASMSLETVGGEDYRAFLIEGRTVKVEVETTGGTVQNLYARVKYGKW